MFCRKGEYCNGANVCRESMTEKYKGLIQRSNDLWEVWKKTHVRRGKKQIESMKSPRMA